MYSAAYYQVLCFRMGLKNLKRLKSEAGSLLLFTAAIRNPLGQGRDLNPVAGLRGRRLLRPGRLQLLVRVYGRSACRPWECCSKSVSSHPVLYDFVSDEFTEGT